VRRGERSDGLFFILEGEVAVYYKTKNMTVKYLDSTDDFGDICLLNKKSHLTYAGLTEVVCMFIPESNLEEILQGSSSDRVFLERRAEVRRRQLFCLRDKARKLQEINKNRKRPPTLLINNRINFQEKLKDELNTASATPSARDKALRNNLANLRPKVFEEDNEWKLGNKASLEMSDKLLPQTNDDMKKADRSVQHARNNLPSIELPSGEMAFEEGITRKESAESPLIHKNILNQASAISFAKAGAPQIFHQKVIAPDNRNMQLQAKPIPSAPLEEHDKVEIKSNLSPSHHLEELKAKNTRPSPLRRLEKEIYLVEMNKKSTLLERDPLDDQMRSIKYDKEHRVHRALSAVVISPEPGATGKDSLDRISGVRLTREKVRDYVLSMHNRPTWGDASATKQKRRKKLMIKKNVKILDSILKGKGIDGLKLSQVARMNRDDLEDTFEGDSTEQGEAHDKDDLANEIPEFEEKEEYSFPSDDLEESTLPMPFTEITERTDYPQDLCRVVRGKFDHYQRRANRVTRDAMGHLVMLYATVSLQIRKIHHINSKYRV